MVAGDNPVFPDADHDHPGRASVLRRLSFDEIPQLLNVVRGEMSIIGPRPTLAYQVERYDEEQLRRLSVRPGVAGWAQLKGRNEIPWARADRARPRVHRPHPVPARRPPDPRRARWSRRFAAAASRAIPPTIRWRRSMADDLVIVGAGGHGRETLDIVEAMNEAGTGSGTSWGSSTTARSARTGSARRRSRVVEARGARPESGPLRDRHRRPGDARDRRREDDPGRVRAGDPRPPRGIGRRRRPAWPRASSWRPARR